MARGLFISFEGGEGAGKSTQIKRLSERLTQAGKKIVTTREPGGTPGAEAIRALLVDGDTYHWDNVSEALLHFAARRDHVKRVIEPALQEGQLVLCDRFFDSTYAYQGYGQGLDKKMIDDIRFLTIEDLKPDLTFLLDIPVEAGLKRVTREQRYERMVPAFHERLRQGFLAMAAKEPKRFRVIDAALPVESVEQAVWEVVKDRL